MPRTGTKRASGAHKKSTSKAKRFDINSTKFDSYISKMGKKKGLSLQKSSIKVVDSITKYLLQRLAVHASDCVVDYAGSKTINRDALETALQCVIPSGGLRAAALDKGDKSVIKLNKSIEADKEARKATDEEP